MNISVLSLLAAFVVLNVAPGYDACGNKIKGYHFDDDTTEYMADSLELMADSARVLTSAEADSL